MESLEAVTAELASEPHWWWGYAAGHGWVVLDRQDARNGGESRHLIRCRDWSPIEVTRTEFSSDQFTGFKKHIADSPNPQAREACVQLLALRREFAGRATGLRVTQEELERRREEEAEERDRRREEEARLAALTEEWFTCERPSALFDCLGAKVSLRKLRLFGIACCHRIWRIMTYEDCRHAVLLAERLVEGDASVEEAARLRDELREKYLASTGHSPRNRKAAVRLWCLGGAANLLQDADDYLQNAPTGTGGADLLQTWQTACWVVAHYHQKDINHPPVEELFAEEHAQAVLLREILGNPFRPVAFDPSWRTSTVLNLASTIYAERAFERMPILADALEDAGCDAQVLRHCRAPGPHVRGCWALDLVLGKS
jgi:hypothetical protein